MVEELRAVDVCLTKVNDFEEVFQDEHVSSRGIFQTIEHPEKGPITVLSQPIKIPGTVRDKPRPPASRFGEHTEELLKELGFSQKEIRWFYKEDVI